MYSNTNNTVCFTHSHITFNVFHTNDSGSNGQLTSADLKVAVAELLGYKPTKMELREIMHTYGSLEDEYSGLNVEQFSKAMANKLSFMYDEDDEIRQMFKAFDLQCRGFLTFEDVKNVFQQITPHLTTQRIASAFREVDKDGDGRLSYKDFEYMMKYDTDGHV